RTHVVHHHPLQPSDQRCFVPGALGGEDAWSFDTGLLAAARAASGPRHIGGPFLPAPLAPLDEEGLALDDLVAFVQHPVRAFLRQRLGLSLRTPDDRPGDALPIELDNLAAWGVGDRLLSAILTGISVDDVCAAEIARGLLPPGALGHGTLQRIRA